MSQDKAPELKIEKDEDLLEVYANNVFFESSVWDIKMLFGTLDQSKDQQISIHQHTAISIPWLQAKVMAYFLHLNIAIHEHNNGEMPMPKRVIPPPPTPPSGTSANDPVAIEAYEAYLKIHKQHFPE